MTLDLAEAPVAMEPPETQRERVLGISLSGDSYCVLEVHSTRIGPGDSEFDFVLETFEASGWYRSSERAGQRRDELERAGLWLSERTKDRMRRGEQVRVSELGWER